MNWKSLCVRCASAARAQRIEDTYPSKVGVPVNAILCARAFHAPVPQASLARNELKTLTPRKWAFPPALHYARVAFHAPEPQASLARNELKINAKVTKQRVKKIRNHGFHQAVVIRSRERSSSSTVNSFFIVVTYFFNFLTDFLVN